MKSIALPILFFFSLLTINFAQGNAIRHSARLTTDAIFKETRALMNRMSTKKINGSNSNLNCLKKGSRIYFRTDKGRIGRLLIVSYGYHLKANIITFNPKNGQVYAQKNNFLIRGTYQYDLDRITQTKSSADIWWQQVNKVERFFVPKNGAKLYTFCIRVIDEVQVSPLFKEVKAYVAKMSTKKINGSINSNNCLKKGSKIYFHTDKGRIGRILITSYGYNLKADIITLDPNNGQVYAQKNNFVIRGTYRYDLDRIAQTKSSADIWWQQVNKVERYLVPKNGAKLYTNCISVKPGIPNAKLFTLIKKYQRRMTGKNINGSNGLANQLKKGTTIYFQTNKGRLGRMKILSYGYNLKVSCITYNPNGTLYSQKNNFVIKGTYLADLDKIVLDKTPADLWWRQVNKTTRYLVPKNGAKFYVAH